MGDVAARSDGEVARQQIRGSCSPTSMSRIRVLPKGERTFTSGCDVEERSSTVPMMEASDP